MWTRYSRGKTGALAYRGVLLMSMREGYFFLKPYHPYIGLLLTQRGTPRAPAAQSGSAPLRSRFFQHERKVYMELIFLAGSLLAKAKGLLAQKG